MIEQFPIEIIQLICTFCAQADVVSLAIAIPTISDDIVKGIYRYVLVDPIPRKLNHNRAIKLATLDEGNEKMVPVTTVTTVAGIKRLLSTLIANKRLASMVHSFTVRGNISLSDNVLIPMVKHSLEHLVNLKEFEWTACPELPPQLLCELPPTELVSLKVDFAARNTHELSSICLPNLRVLSVRPFIEMNYLRWLSRMVTECTDLETLEISRYLDAKREIGSSFTFLGMSDVNTHQERVAAISTFFEPIVGQKWQLRRLSLIQTDTNHSDVYFLQRNVDIPYIKELKLVGTGNECEYDHGLLKHITAERPQLKKAELNWRASEYAICAFIKECCSNSTTLKLTLKSSVGKIIEFLVSNSPQLVHLELDIECQYTHDDLEPLKMLSKIEFLRVPYCFSARTWEVVTKIPGLKVLKLCNSSPQRSAASGSYSARPSLGLLTNGIMDSWNDHLQSPFKSAYILDAARRNPSIECVVVDDHVTNLSHNSVLDEYVW